MGIMQKLLTATLCFGNGSLLAVWWARCRRVLAPRAQLGTVSDHRSTGTGLMIGQRWVVLKTLRQQWYVRYGMKHCKKRTCSSAMVADAEAVPTSEGRATEGNVG